jgi:hypothetical protein
VNLQVNLFIVNDEGHRVHDMGLRAVFLVRNTVWVMTGAVSTEVCVV